MANETVAAGHLPGMLARRRGGVLNVASTAAFQPGPRAGRRIVIPGLVNKLGVQSLRISPRGLVTRVVGGMQKRRH